MRKLVKDIDYCHFSWTESVSFVFFYLFHPTWFSYCLFSWSFFIIMQGLNFLIVFFHGRQKEGIIIAIMEEGGRIEGGREGDVL